MYGRNCKRTTAASLAALSLALLGCDGLVEEVGSHGVPLFIGLPIASSALVEQPLPGCEAAAPPSGGTLSVWRHPTVPELAVAVLEDGTALCIDEPAAILERYPTAVVPAAEVPMGGMAADQPQDDDPVPITNGASDPRANLGGQIGGNTPRGDDPVPIKGEAINPGAGDEAQGTNVGDDQPAGDDPVPIHGQTSSSQAQAELRGDDDVGDDPVPIQPQGGLAGRPPAAW